MFYRYSLLVPAATPATAPEKKTMYLCHGIIHQVEMAFPPGCAGLVHASIWRFDHQAWPTNPDESFAWDDYNVVITQESLGLTTRPYTMTLRAWSQDDTYEHTVVCRLGIRLPAPHRPGSWVTRLLRGETQG